MNVFNLFAKLSLDKNSYDYALKESTQLSKESSKQVKQWFKEMSDENVASMKRIVNAFKNGEITFKEYKEAINEVRKAQKELDAESKELGLTTEKTGLASVASWAAIGAAVVAVTKKIVNLATETANYADKIGDTAEKWGFSTQEIQEFQYWADMNGTTLESLMTGMRGLVNQAEAGSSAFEKLGVSVKDNSGNLKGQKELFLETMTALQGVENQTERNALQFEIFGRSGIELGQIINLTSDELNALSQKANDYGLIISDEAIKASSDFNDELGTLKSQFQSVLAEMLAGTPEAEEKFEKFLDNMIDFAQKYLPKFVKFGVNLLAKLIEALARALPDIIPVFIEAIFDINWFEVGLNIAKAIVKGIWTGIKRTFGALIGYGWLWGKEDNNNAEVDVSSTSQALSSVTTSQVSERTTKVDETLDITLSVESDGTNAGQQNLDVISDLLVDKINKVLGDEING